MRFAFLLFALLAVSLAGCGNSPKIREEATDVSGTLTLPGGASPKDMTVSFFPQQNTPPGGAKVGADGKFTAKLAPGKYSVYFDEEANAKNPAYKKLPEKYHKSTCDHIVTVESGKELVIEVK